MVGTRGRPRAADSQLLERREEIKHLIEIAGLWNIPRKQMAEKWNCDPHTIDRDIRNIVKGIPKPDLEEIRINFQLAYKKASSEMQRIMATGTNAEKMQAARTLKEVERGFNDLLESHGLKEIRAERIKIDLPMLLKDARGSKQARIPEEDEEGSI